MAESPEKQDDKKRELTEPNAVTVEGRAAGLHYTVETGQLPIRNDEGEIEALITYHYYRVGEDRNRPVTFTFNGGPGSPSLWLHLGALGPWRVQMQPDGDLPAAPYQIVENPDCWLGFTDLVFIDPVGTGFSRAKDDKTGEKFWGVKGDIESISEFIRLFLSRKDRWTSPLYLAGESYGTTRAAGIAGYLADRGVAFAGIMLVSSIMNFQTARFTKGNDLPYALFLPTYTATAHFHGRLSGDLHAVINEAREFALGDYWAALAQGDLLTGAARTKIRKKLARLTGLSESYLDGCDLRPNIHDFCKELLRDQNRSVGRLDSRFKGIDDRQHGHFQRAEHDPSMSLLMGPYVALYCDYCHRELGYRTDEAYHVFMGVKKPWDWGSAGDGFPDTSEALRKAMARNPHMRVFVASGYYDLATPFFATEYTVSHLGLDPALRSNIEIAEYPAGHMMYIDVECLAKFGQDAADFVARSRQAPNRGIAG